MWYFAVCEWDLFYMVMIFFINDLHYLNRRLWPAAVPKSFQLAPAVTVLQGIHVLGEHFCVQISRTLF